MKKRLSQAPQPGPGLLPERAPAAGQATNPSPTSLEGHRRRVRQRLLQAGPGAVADHELLELVLFIAQPRCDTKAIARALLDRFGGFADAISADPASLQKVDGIGLAGAAALKTVHAAAARLLEKRASGERRDAPILSNWEKLLDYLRAEMARDTIEQFRILFLDSRNKLLANVAQARGTVNHTPVYPREVVRQALDLNATALILVHNHPSGDPTPSRDDIDMTREICAAAQTFGIVVHDHLIIGDGTWTSFRQQGLL
jgi:DNA repair protein RadC